MKATMSITGIITLKAETEIEGFALANWSKIALIPMNDLERKENCYFRGSMILVDGDPENKQEVLL